MAHRRTRPFFKFAFCRKLKGWRSVSRANSLPYKYFWNFCTPQTTAKHSFSTVAYSCSHLQSFWLAYRSKSECLGHIWQFQDWRNASLYFAVDSALSAPHQPVDSFCPSPACGQLLPLTSRWTASAPHQPVDSFCPSPASGQLLPLTSRCISGQLLPLTSRCISRQLLPLTNGTFLVLPLGLAL